MAKDLLRNKKQQLEILTTNIDSQTNKFLSSHKEYLIHKGNEIQMGSYKFLVQHNQNLTNLINNFKTSSSSLTNELKLNLQKMTQEFLNQMHNYLGNLRRDIVYFKKDLGLERFQKLFRDYRENLSKRYADIKRYSLQALKASITKIRYYEDKINILDPMNVVRRGFSITKRRDGKTVKSIKDVQKNDGISTIVSDGRIDSQVEEIERRNKDG